LPLLPAEPPEGFKKMKLERGCAGSQSQQVRQVLRLICDTAAIR
jgi:hypothetical protein